MSENKCTVVKFKGYLKFIDLGLPSGTKWAAYNVGATSPYEAGDYFSWGNIDGHAASEGYNFSEANYNASAGATLTGDIPVSAAYDMARANFGNKAKLPTKEQFIELVDNCTTEWITINGRNGMKFTSTINGRSIFLPACGYFYNTTHSGNNTDGYYWSGSIASPTAKAHGLNIFSTGIASQYKQERQYGLNVRAVM